PWLSDRDIALQNVQYVLGAAGNLHEDFQPVPGGFIQKRADQVLHEAIELLERIAEDRGGRAALLNAIADGTFGIMKRPATGGKGLDGVAEHAEGYYNPASEILEADTAGASERAPREGGRNR
ncbi:MAG: lysine 5,6-aminomutase subunit alpha TIM-barrel domain-containing protein, partial [Micromonosporaceae bacterium]